MELEGGKELVDTGKSSRTWSVPTISLCLAVLNVFQGIFGHKGGLLKRTDVHHRLSYNHKFFTSVHACAVQFNHTGSMCPLLGWGAPLSMYITRKIKGRGKRMCAMWLCVWGIPSRVRCPVLQWKHPGLQLRWSQVRIPLPGLPEADQAERQLGQRQATGGVAASHREWAVAGRTAAGAWAHFSN